MTTARQSAANQRNAKKSTGPRSAHGKAAVALNGVSFGLFSREVAVKSERRAELAEHGKRLRSQLAPYGELELLLADRIVATSWRLKRVGRIETELFDAVANLGEAIAGYRGKNFALLSRYEGALERSLFRTIQELKALQAERQARALPPPPPIEGEAVPNDRGLALPTSMSTDDGRLP